MSYNSNSTNNIKQQHNSMHNSSSYEPTNTTFVQANPSNFRAIVQHLTGSHSVSSSSQPGSGISDVGIRQTTSFKLHERRQHHHQQQQGVMRKLEMIKLNESPNYYGPGNGLFRARVGNEMSQMAMISPNSTLDGLGLGIGSPSPRADPRCSLSEEEERVVIVEKGFYLHPISPLSIASRDCKPQLLPLFPLHSPRDGQD
ncbi:VQ motif-containing protein 33-like [Amaranthus tricolor]|uniref:VQ motif-containing protein 33-like n=1 Tax=Amaranthus tricolor TaxID=29722 RepID=UPI00258D69F5|nr:VQ motif-containing protein 33-like [Amaranthus tricolor]